MQGPLVKSGLLQYKLKQARNKVLKTTKAFRSMDRKAVKVLALHIQSMNDAIVAEAAMERAKKAYEKADKLEANRLKRRMDASQTALAAENASSGCLSRRPRRLARPKQCSEPSWVTRNSLIPHERLVLFMHHVVAKRGYARHS